MHLAAPHKRDFAPNVRLPRIALLAAVIGVTSTLAAVVLLNLIHLFTNLFFFGHWSFADRSPAGNTLGAWVIAVPVAGGLVVGLIARFGSEKIRGHGIPEAIEAILFGKSRMSPKVAVLKPLSSGIVIGSGGPFGAEGPIIMTGGALGSLIAQCFKLTAAERKTLLVAGAAAGMTAVFGTPVAAVLLAVELLLFEWRPRSFLPVALACAVAGFARARSAWAANRCSRSSPPRRPPRRSASACWRACCPARWPAAFRPRSIAPRTRSASCRCTGCGGPRWAASWSASAAGWSRARWASATT